MRAKDALAGLAASLSFEQAHQILRHAGIPIFGFELRVLTGPHEPEQTESIRRLLAELTEDETVLLDAVLERLR